MQSWLTQAQTMPATNSRGGAVNGAPYQPGPACVVLESSNATSLRIALQSYAESGRVPHFTLDPITKEVAQHVDLQLAAVKVTDFPVEPHRFGLNIWVVVLSPAGQPLDVEQSEWVGEQVGIIADAVGALKMLHHGDPMQVGEFQRFDAVVLASDVPNCPGSNPRIDIEALFAGMSLPEGVAEALKDIEEGNVVTVLSHEEFVEMLEGDAAAGPIAVDVVTLDVEPDAPKVVVTSDTVLGKFPGRKVKVGSGGKAVAQLLEAFGLGGKKFDNELEDHVKMIQELAGLDITGEVDSDTWDAIDTYLLEDQQ